MKLLFCPHCQDVRKLGPWPFGGHANTDPTTKCACGKSWGRYTDDINAVYGGDAVMLGFANSSLAQAIKDNAAYGGVCDEAGGPLWGRNFTAFIIPESAPSVRRESTKE